MCWRGLAGRFMIGAFRKRERESDESRSIQEDRGAIVTKCSTPGAVGRRFLAVRRAVWSPGFLFFCAGVAALALASARAGDDLVESSINPEEIRPVPLASFSKLCPLRGQ